MTQQEQVRVQLSTSLIAVLSQQLCARADKPGRVAAYEFLVVTPAVSNLIRESKTFRIDSAIQTGRKFGMQLLDDHLWKLYADGKGKETETPMTNESYDFGLFSAKPGDGAFGSKDVIAFERRPLGSGTHVFEFVVSKKPAWAGVDPYNKRIDRNSDDNLIQVDK